MNTPRYLDIFLSLWRNQPMRQIEKNHFYTFANAKYLPRVFFFLHFTWFLSSSNVHSMKYFSGFTPNNQQDGNRKRVYISRYFLCLDCINLSMQKRSENSIFKAELKIKDKTKPKKHRYQSQEELFLLKVV